MQTVDWGKQHLKKFPIRIIHNRINICLPYVTLTLSRGPIFEMVVFAGLCEVIRTSIHAAV